MISDSYTFSKNKAASTVQPKLSFLGVFSKLQLLEYHFDQAEAVLKELFSTLTIQIGLYLEKLFP